MGTSLFNILASGHTPFNRREDSPDCARLCARKSAVLLHLWTTVDGMSRPRMFEETRVATAVRLPESVHRRLHQAAADRDVSANLLVTRAVCEFLDRLPSADDVLAVGEPSEQKGSR
jgi:predicted transcriptional regulator